MLDDKGVKADQTITQYFEGNLKIKEERGLYNHSIIETRYYQYDVNGILEQINVFIGRKNPDNTLLESSYIYCYTPDYGNNPNGPTDQWKMEHIRALDDDLQIEQAYYQNNLRIKDVRYSDHICHYKYDRNNKIIREEVWNKHENEQGKIEEGRLAHYYDYVQNKDGDYLLMFINPANGRYKWRIEGSEDKTCCQVAILEFFSNMEMYDEIISYVKEQYQEVATICFTTAVAEFRFTKAEQEQLNNGDYEKKYGIKIVP
ncbi:hypothetical protein SAMN04488134_11245 [Amphibacillus marinus]|uniref:Uncharacterized protein n=1 Tax=Amphibacillus marinus TaxID=872970 RepID=A0A1H8S9E7_9BACI|nr:hypothetical protein [Amphibacillus marinus]SEO75146.1 hypothetical protein SAMN04488134_11245 [Amphibacillus marinus]